MQRWIVIVSLVALLLGLCGVLGVYELGRMRARQKDAEARANAAENLQIALEAMRAYNGDASGPYPGLSTQPPGPLIPRTDATRPAASSQPGTTHAGTPSTR